MSLHIFALTRAMQCGGFIRKIPTPRRAASVRRWRERERKEPRVKLLCRTGRRKSNRQSCPIASRALALLLQRISPEKESTAVGEPPPRRWCEKKEGGVGLSEIHSCLSLPHIIWRVLARIKEMPIRGRSPAVQFSQHGRLVVGGY